MLSLNFDEVKSFQFFPRFENKSNVALFGDSSESIYTAFCTLINYVTVKKLNYIQIAESYAIRLKMSLTHKADHYRKK